MGADEIRDGTRIGRLLSSEVHGHERGALGRLRVVDADGDVDATEAGAFAFAIAVGDGEDGAPDGSAGGERRIAEAYVHPDRLRVEFLVEAKTAVEAGEAAGLRTRPKAVEPPRTLVFAERGADAKAGLRVVRDVAEAILDDAG